jgi:putative transcriptional regulator
MNNIKIIRERLGLTQAALAQRLGCTQGNIGHYENKNQTIPPETAKRLISVAAEIGCAITYEDIYGPVSRGDFSAIDRLERATSP